MNSSVICHDDRRREQVRARPELNGLDYLEVSDDQLSLTVYFLGKAPTAIKPGGLQYVRVEGGRRIRDIKVVGVDVRREADPELDDRMIVRVDKYGDYSTYTLRLVGLGNIDARYDHLEFSFKAGCPSDLDCAPSDASPPMSLDEPQINYLAKDYASFRQLILDRLALIMPGWQERHVPDLGITLVEILAYVGDHLSYYQDAVATEAYLDTARQRISVRRHARLVDYALHEGCNARAFVYLETSVDHLTLGPRDAFFITGLNDVPATHASTLHANELGDLMAGSYEVYEPIGEQPIQLYKAHNELHFYTWGEHTCCLPRGTTSASLLYDWALPAALPDTKGGQSAKPQPAPVAPAAAPNSGLHLKAGDVLIFEEIVGPRTGHAADANPRQRHAVRLTRVDRGEDPLYDPPVQLVEIEWAAEDALPFALCISAISAAPACTYHPNVSVARGNVVLVDHGWSTDRPEKLGVVSTAATAAACDCEGQAADVTLVPQRFEARLTKTPLTWSQSLPRRASAARLLAQNPRLALPQIDLIGIPAARTGSGTLFEPADLSDPSSLIARLRDTADDRARYLYSRLSSATQLLLAVPASTAQATAALRRHVTGDLRRLHHWTARPDLLGSSPVDEHYVAEMDNDGYAHLHTGDGDLGHMPAAGTVFYATYRVGNGARGNVGAGAITQIVFRTCRQEGIVAVRNPLPASGGVDPEPLAEARLAAPASFRKQLQRAITADDYVQVVQREFKHKVQRAAATLNWTGSWYEVQVAIDPLGAQETAPALLRQIAGMLHRYRRIDHDITVGLAHYVSLDVELIICVEPHSQRGPIERTLRDVLGNGTRGFFHPDNLSFGESIYLSKLVAVAQAVEGVASVQVIRLQRQFDPTNTDFVYTGVLPFGPLEVARLDNDPSYPEHGTLVLNFHGAY